MSPISVKMVQPECGSNYVCHKCRKRYWLDKMLLLSYIKQFDSKSRSILAISSTRRREKQFQRVNELSNNKTEHYFWNSIDTKTSIKSF